VTGYRIQIQHTGQEIDLPRNQTTHLLEYLSPGKLYFVRVKAKNKVGSSEYSDWNSPSDASTCSDRPETPLKPKPIAGTWSSISCSCVLPFANGSKITSMQVQKRVISTFFTGQWSEPPESFRIPQDVVVLEEVDYEEQQMRLSMEEMRCAQEAKNVEYNPLKKKSGKGGNSSSATAKKKEKPSGSKLKFKMRNLDDNVVYQFRIRFKNDADYSEYSDPSHKVKTNKAEPPSQCSPPSVARPLMAGDTSILLSLPFPSSPGGAPITSFWLEYRDVDLNITLSQGVSMQDRPLGSQGSIDMLISSLRPTGFYQFRVRAENLVGPGQYSEWSDEIEMPGDYII
jgi:hypothetical protein